MGGCICNPGLRVGSPIYFDKFSESSEDEREGTGIIRLYFRDWRSLSPPKLSPTRYAGNVQKSRSGSVPPIDLRTFNHLHISDIDIGRNPRGADSYIQNLKDDTMSQVSSILSLTDSIRSSADGMKGEFERHERVISKSNKILEETDAVLRTKAGLRYVSGQITNPMSKKSLSQFSQSNPPIPKAKFLRKRSLSGPVILPSYISKHSLAMQKGLALLGSQFDEIEEDALKIKEQLEYQEPMLNDLDINVTNLDVEIKQQTYLTYLKLGQLRR